MKKSYKITGISFSLLLMFFASSCKKFVEIDSPRTDLIKATVFASDATAEAAMLDIYYRSGNSSDFSFSAGSFISISHLGAICSDEEINYYTGGPEFTAEVKQFADNAILSDNSNLLRLWSGFYSCLYGVNAIIEGLALPSSQVSENKKKQLEGEAKFIRAFCYFYLVNLWGDVPLITSTGYQVNNTMTRTAEEEVYGQIIKDLTDAQNLLPDDYSFAGNQRIRANKYAAIALLARAYLHKGEWANAEQQATQVINATALYGMTVNLAEVFRITSSEAILQFWSESTANERSLFNVVSTGPSYGSLRPAIANSFEAGDQRWAVWGRSRIINNVTYYYSLKYLTFPTPPIDYFTVLRLAEQYLIRAEARAQLNNTDGAKSDINVIRHRASLGDTPANDKASLLLAVEEERKHEFFNEWGHRWFDLKRSGRADAVLASVKSQWKSTAALFPIPQVQIVNNPAVTQNPGY